MHQPNDWTRLVTADDVFFGGGIALVIVLFAVASLVLPIVAAIRAFTNGDNGWGIGILIGMFVPFGFVIAMAYLLSPQKARRV